MPRSRMKLPRKSSVALGAWGERGSAVVVTGLNAASVAKKVAMNAQLAVEDLIALVQPVKFRKVVKSAIHVGFVPLHRNAINRESVHESLSLIFLKMSQVKSSRRAFVQSYSVSLQRMQR